MTTDEFDGDRNEDAEARERERIRKLFGPPETVEEWDSAREYLASGRLKMARADLAEAEEGIDRALANRDHGAFAYWTSLLPDLRERLDSAEDEHVRAQLRRLDGDDDDKPEVIA